MATFVMLLAILTGTWQCSAGDTTVYETWGAPRADLLLGTGQTVRGDRTVGFEFLRIVQRENGLVYIAQPEGDAPTEFALVDTDEDLFVFENPAHDHPRRITYRLSGEEMSVTLEGSEPTQVLRFRKVP